MKNISKIFLLCLTCGLGQAFGQTDRNGNPVFNSVSLAEKAFGDLLLISNYYTLNNNLENKKSSVFVSENPTLDQIEKAAISLPSDFFILTKESKMVVMVLLRIDPERQFFTIEMRTQKHSIFECTLVGDITENRANEIIENKYDTTASIENGKLRFNGKEFKIISSEEIEEAVSRLIKEARLDKMKPSDVLLLPRKDIKNYILTETKQGGKLDFFTEIKGKELNGIQVKPGIFTTNQSAALYKWGRACFNLGVNTIEDAYRIFEEHLGSELNNRDKQYIKAGFYKEWEK